MKILIFDENITGHHLEYLHYYYRGALMNTDDEFVFCLEDGFLTQKSQFVWPERPNISFDFMSSAEIDYARKAKGVQHATKMTNLITKKAKDHCADRIILTNFMFLIPFLLFRLPKGIKVRGIIYRIFLYNKYKNSTLRQFVDTLMYWLMAMSRVMEKIFILNDQKSADELNAKFHTDKFTFLPDPVPEVEMSKLVNLRTELNIPATNKVFFHFGGLTKRKGTIEILKAINLSLDADLRDKTFVFAGRIYKDMQEEFYELLKVAGMKTQILVFDQFCEYDFLYNMCYTCDVILMPYKQTELSSGVLGYAAVFQKPVIGPSDGLIGRLIKDFNMGLAINDVSAPSLLKNFNSQIEWVDCKYAKQNDVKEFISTILR